MGQYQESKLYFEDRKFDKETGSSDYEDTGLGNVLFQVFEDAMERNNAYKKVMQKSS